MDYNSLIKSLKNNLSTGESRFESPERHFEDVLDNLISKNEVSSGKNSTNTTLFSDFFGQDIREGSVAEFKRNKLRYNAASKQVYYGLGYGEVRQEVSNLMGEYNRQLIAKNKWLGLMGMMERMLHQFDLYSNPSIVFSTQKQKSGKNYFRYILLRTPFYDLVTGRYDLRVYFNKLEDYPQFKTIDELVKGDVNFVSEARKEIRKKMKEVIDSNPISFTDVQNGLKQIESDRDRNEVARYEAERLEWMKQHNFKID